MKTKENPFSVKKSEDSSGFLLWQVTNLWQREIRKALEIHELTQAQFVLLASIHWLTLSKTEVTQILLSDHTKIDPMTTSTVLKTLIAKKLIVRREHSVDTRAKVVLLTDEGKKLANKSVQTVEKFDAEFFKILGKQSFDFNRQLLSLLKKKSQ
jgi:MarR family transcriptional regulator, organic hydroperoxide resistance regulator